MYRELRLIYTLVYTGVLDVMLGGELWLMLAGELWPTL